MILGKSEQRSPEDISVILVVTPAACWDEPHVMPCLEDASHTNQTARHQGQHAHPGIPLQLRVCLPSSTGSLVCSHQHWLLEAICTLRHFSTWYPHVWCFLTVVLSSLWHHITPLLVLGVLSALMVLASCLITYLLFLVSTPTLQTSTENFPFCYKPVSVV